MAINVVRPINIARMCRMAKLFNKEYDQTGIIAVNSGLEVHIQRDFREEVAPLDQWTIYREWDDAVGHNTEVFVMVGKVRFFALIITPLDHSTTEEEHSARMEAEHE